MSEFRISKILDDFEVLRLRTCDELTFQNSIKKQMAEKMVEIILKNAEWQLTPIKRPDLSAHTMESLMVTLKIDSDILK